MSCALFKVNERIYITPEGGIAIKMINRTGAHSIKGTIVEAGTVDGGFVIAPADADDAIGVVYEDQIPDRQECLVCFSGRAQVLLKDSTAASPGYWIGTSNVAGRADATNATPPAAPAHFQEIGHCVETVTAGTGKLAFCMLHFN